MTHPSASAGGCPSPGPVPADRPSGPAGLGVPLSVWPGLPAPGRALAGRPCGGQVTVAAARQVIGAFSRPGDLVAAAGGCPAVTEAAPAAGRAVIALTPDRRSGYPAGVPYLVTRLRPGGPAARAAHGNPVTGQAALAIAGRHGPGCCTAPGDDGDDGLLYAACEQALRPGGILAVITAGPDGGSAGTVVAAARAAGLLYAQHIILLCANVDGDHLSPGPVPTGEAALPGGALVHSDLLVFTKPGGPRP